MIRVYKVLIIKLHSYLYVVEIYKVTLTLGVHRLDLAVWGTGVGLRPLSTGDAELGPTVAAALVVLRVVLCWTNQSAVLTG